MSTSRRQSNGRSPLLAQQRSITSFFSKFTSSPSSVTSKQKSNPDRSLDTNPSPSPSPATPSPRNSKPKNKPLLLIGASSPPSPSPLPPLPPSLSVDKQSFGQDVIGRRIKVYWPLDKAWYEGCVKSFDKVTGRHLVRYDDDEEESLELAKEKIEWVQESGKKLKRLRRGFSDSKKTVIEDTEVEENVDNKVDESRGDDGGDDDSSDEDWGKNGTVEDAEDGEEDMELDDEEDGAERSNRKRSGKVETRKRKLGREEKSGPAKKSKSGGQVGKEGLKISCLDPTSDLQRNRPCVFLFPTFI